MAEREVADVTHTTLASLGLDECWLETWLQKDPKRLGLGASVRIVRAQMNQPGGKGPGRLDLQAVDEALENRVYDIELMRGMLDADHGFRTLDYWAREQKNEEDDREHRPVVVAEQLRASRYWTLLELLADRLGLIGLEVRCMQVQDKAVVWLEPVLLPADMRAAGNGEGATAVTGALTETDWKARTTREFQGFVHALRQRAKDWGLTHKVVWSAKSYIGLWKNSRCWCPIWPRKDAAGRVYLPVPGGWTPAVEGQAPPEFAALQADLSATGIAAVWAWTYNMGSNPIAVTIRADQLDDTKVRALFEASWKGMA